jgi:hypothetical protein
MLGQLMSYYTGFNTTEKVIGSICAGPALFTPPVISNQFSVYVYIDVASLIEMKNICKMDETFPKGLL